MDLQLKERVIVVTGGAKGLGAAIVRASAKEGAIPVIVDRDREAGQTIERELRNGGATCGLITRQLSSAQGCAEAVQESMKALGRMDALVNNAGVNDQVGLESGNPSEFVASLNRNLMHYYNMAHYALPHLKRSKGVIINIASKTAMTGQGGTCGYACAQGGILALTREWAAELLPYGLRVNAVVPAEVTTPLYREWLGTSSRPEGTSETILSRIPLGKRMTTPEEIAATVVFLISPQSGHTTGQQICVDGGYVHLDRARP